MSPAKAVLKRELEATQPTATPASPLAIPSRFPNVRAGTDLSAAGVLRPVSSQSAQRQTGFNFQPRVPVITGEATYRGHLPIDGVISGQLSASGSGLTIRQRPRAGRGDSVPELDGEIRFKDMLRVNGHVAGAILSDKGTLIVDPSARIDAFIDVAVAVVYGTVYGDVVGRERVELGPEAVIHGNICTARLSMKPGATFQGDCRMPKLAE